MLITFIHVEHSFSTQWPYLISRTLFKSGRSYTLSPLPNGHVPLYFLWSPEIQKRPSDGRTCLELFHWGSFFWIPLCATTSTEFCLTPNFHPDFSVYRNFWVVGISEPVIRSTLILGHLCPSIFLKKVSGEDTSSTFRFRISLEYNSQITFSTVEGFLIYNMDVFTYVFVICLSLSPYKRFCWPDMRSLYSSSSFCFFLCLCEGLISCCIVHLYYVLRPNHPHRIGVIGNNSVNYLYFAFDT